MTAYLYVLKPIRTAMLTEGPTSEEEVILGRHFEYIQSLKKNGTLRLAGRTTQNDESTLGVVVFMADSENDARRVMEEDPAVSQHVMSAKLSPFRIAAQSS